jgi:magnesium-transporting ATPase (P-type)
MLNGILVPPTSGLQVLRPVSDISALSGTKLTADRVFAYGGLPTQYDPDAFAEAVNVAQSVYFFTLVGMQWGNLLSTRTRRLSIFQANPFGPNSPSRNLWIPPAMLASVSFLFFFSYVPFFQNTFLTRVSAIFEHSNCNGNGVLTGI